MLERGQWFICAQKPIATVGQDEIQVRSIVALDPGVRTFVTAYAVNCAPTQRTACQHGLYQFSRSQNSWASAVRDNSPPLHAALNRSIVSDGTCRMPICMVGRITRNHPRVKCVCLIGQMPEVFADDPGFHRDHIPTDRINYSPDTVSAVARSLGANPIPGKVAFVGSDFFAIKY